MNDCFGDIRNCITCIEWIIVSLLHNVAITQIISMKIYSVMYVPVITDMEQYIAVEGHPTQLPCDVTPPKAGEQVSLVLWYRQGDGGEPIYR